MRRCNLCNPPVLPCRGQAKLGEDHPQTLTYLNNLALLLKAQGHLAKAEPLYREALEKSPGAQLERFQRDFGQWIWNQFIRLISGFGFAACFLQVSHDRNWCSVIFSLSNFQFPIVFAEHWQICWCMLMFSHEPYLYQFISRDCLGHRLQARESDTVQPKNVRKSVSKYFCFDDIDRHRLHCCQESSRFLVAKCC